MSFAVQRSNPLAEYLSLDESVRLNLNPYSTRASEANNLVEAVDNGSTIERSPYSISKFAEQVISIQRKPLSFEGREYLRWIYDISPDYPVASKRIVWQAGRQVEKSTTLVGKAVALCLLNPFFQVLTVEPRSDQVSLFSTQRFRPICEDSEIISNAWIGSSSIWQVGARGFLNGSINNFKSCYYTADATRGVTANMLEIDEVQDIISDNIPIIEQSMSHIPRDERFYMFTGTPKTSSNPLSRMFKETCQFEWLVRCSACKRDNYLDDKIVGKKSYICTRCGKQIYMRDGRWVSLRPSRLDYEWGFRMPQMMVPFIDHADILAKMENPNIPRKVLFNEVLGLDYDEGELVLTKTDILRQCEAARPASTPANTRSMYNVKLCAGIDHGTGGYSPSGFNDGTIRRKGMSPSFTVVAFGGFTTPNIFSVFKIVKFTGEMANLAKQPEILNSLVREYGATWAMSDYGFGAHTNARLHADHGWSYLESPGNPLLMECMYITSLTPVSFHPASFRYMVDRNAAIERTVDAIKRGYIKFFRQEDMAEFMDDFTSIYVEYNFRTNRMTYDHTLPDDAFHAVLYCYHAALQRAGRLVPTAVPSLT
jgi:hypothetical protein